ncbi:hypothetical protein CR513_37022, partial [Mucuna pruriens]
MGDLLASPRVAPLFWVDLRVFFTLMPLLFLLVLTYAFSAQSETLTFWTVFCRFSCFSHSGIHIVINHATLDRCDHTSTNALDPIRTPESSVLRREL